MLQLMAVALLPSSRMQHWARHALLILQIIAHLDAETAYCKAALADTEDLQEQLYTEMRGRIQVCIIS